MAIAEDPIFPAPGLPLDIMGWFTVHIGASDVAVTEIRPQFMTYTLLLPPACPESDAKTIIVSISEAARELGISIVGGHTGWYDAVAYPRLAGGIGIGGIEKGDAQF
jgi:hydrogenase maturation factor